MGHLRIIMIMAAALVLNMLLALTGCGDDHGDHFRSDRDRPPEHYEQRDNGRHDERNDGDRHEDHGRDSGHEGEHERGDR